MQKVAVITGAGISADSGLSTFRDAGGLWEGYEISEVATVDAWEQNKEQVLEFYNKRRQQAHQVKPNEGHRALASLEEEYQVSVITQNVDNLHEQAGSSSILHLHGELSKVRSEDNPHLIYDIGGDCIQIGDTAEDGSQLRPHVVWFGESVPNIQKAASEVAGADCLIVIGTSLAVYPAAGLIDIAVPGIPKYIIDPAEPELPMDSEWNHIQKRAAVGTPQLVEELLANPHI